jgi:hypothetical protein
MRPDVIDWHSITPFNGTQHGGFEELCKQLYGAECRAAGAEWTPTGKVDGGVEGYGTFPNGDEWGLQAKWFLESPGPKQWQEVQESVLTALRTHPRLVRYVIYFPLDLSDAREADKQTAHKRWLAAKARFEKAATAAGMSVVFDLRVSSDIVTELVKSTNAGLRYYFFNGADLSPERVRARIEDTINVVGERYSRTLNVEVPLSQYVEAMTLSEEFVTRAFEFYRKVDAASSILTSAVVEPMAAGLRTACSALLDQIKPLSNDASTSSRNYARRERPSAEIRATAPVDPTHGIRSKKTSTTYGGWLQPWLICRTSPMVWRRRSLGLPTCCWLAWGARARRIFSAIAR